MVELGFKLWFALTKLQHKDILERDTESFSLGSILDANFVKGEWNGAVYFHVYKFSLMPPFSVSLGMLTFFKLFMSPELLQNTCYTLHITTESSPPPIGYPCTVSHLLHIFQKLVDIFCSLVNPLLPFLIVDLIFFVSPWKYSGDCHLEPCILSNPHKLFKK